MSRAYIRLDPGFFERKVIGQGYSAGLAMALVGALCLGEQQVPRGRFRNERVLRALLSEFGRYVPELIRRGDITRNPDGSLYVDGWDEWQEGDVTVRERMVRIRNRKASRDGGERNNRYGDDRNEGNGGDSHATVPSRPASSSSNSREAESGTGRDGTYPPTPAERGTSEDEKPTTPRAMGTSPRQLARAEEMAKRDRASRRQQAYLRHLITAEQLDEMNRRDAPLEELPRWEDPVETPIASWFDRPAPARVEVLKPLDPETIATRRRYAIEMLRNGGLAETVAADLRAAYGISDADLAQVPA